MFKPILCITQHHDLRLVFLAAVVCLLASATMLRMIDLSTKSAQKTKMVWRLCAGAVGGAGAWSTHFIAMLAYDPGVALGYDFANTALSFAIAILGASGAILWSFAVKERLRPLAWGGAFGVTIAVMHYTGLAALDFRGVLTLEPLNVAASILVGVALSILSMRLLGRQKPVMAFPFASLCLTAAICSLHFIGMSAIVMHLDPVGASNDLQVPRDVLAIWVGALTGLIVFTAALIMFLQNRSSSAALKLLRAVMDVIPHGVAYYDSEDRLTLSNDALRRTLLLNDGDFRKGTTYRDVVLELAESGAVALAVGREQAWTTEVVEARANGSSTRYLEMSDGRFLQIDNYRIASEGMVSIVADVTRLKRQADDLKVARDVAEAAVRARSEFLANMSHELRTPMNGVIAIAGLLAQENLTPKQAELASIIHDSAVTLDRLLSDILDVARVDAGAVEIAEAPFELAVAIERLAALYRAKADEKGVEVKVHVHPDAATTVMGDEVRIKQIIGNLISNAVKFTQKGSVTITAERAGGSVVVSVEDTGIGFDDSFKAKMFTRFEQADASNTRRFGGTGLGLSIARDLAHRLGGEISCRSEVGKGSVFQAALPLQIAAPLTASRPEGSPAGHPDQAHILVVDDNPTNQKILALILEGAGIRTTLADNGQEALTLWRAQCYDAILMDIQMPVMDGLTATSAIRAEEAETGRERTAILMVSANAFAEHVRASLRAGADGHVAKPVTAERLFSALEALGEVAPDDMEAQAA